MKERKSNGRLKIGIVILVFATMVGIIVLSIFQIKEKQSIIAEYRIMTSKEIIDSLTLLGNENFFEVLGILFQQEETIDSETLNSITMAWATRCNQFSPEDYQSIIMDETNSLAYRETAVYIYTSVYEKQTEQVNEELIKLLDQDLGGEIKIYIIQAISVSEEKLEKLFLEEKGDTAYWALKMLSHQNAKRASEISEKYLEDETLWEEDIEKVKAAIVAAEERCRKDESKKEKSFQQLKNIVEKQSEVNEDIVETAQFSLSAMKYDKAISFLINSDKVERDRKIFAIGENTDTLKKMIETGEEKDIVTVRAAMKLSSEDSVLEKLEKVK